MRWLFRSVMVLSVLAMLPAGCGSTAGDRLVLRFIRWDTTSLPNQQDTVSQSSARIDVVPDLCITTTGGANVPPTCEITTPTTINAVFENDQATDIRLDSYTVHIVGDIGVGDVTLPVPGLATIVGGRCSTATDRQCAIDADCTVGGSTGTCTHGQTTVPGIEIFTCDQKAHIDPHVFGQLQAITITFFGSDPNQDFQTTASYTAEFGDFCNCLMGTACAPALGCCSVCAMTQTPTCNL